ncbi:SDR family oxidoreductase [Salmonella enterica subsp. enterica serovar Sandiego]|uniref:SDR family NAD(P)-dependent oxidoreductase n=1 Tax=Cronobacter dublinensis TaxID=413497 RepID=UPI00029C0D12|nr:glucose 1-dehydrogenase [Cronobacter dublinensis]EAO3839866.1 SDR family oxidoreductase [Salmonella enterica]EDX8170758.1 SDR family oxidoreductase [Salmonella enterica subsp. enterica serovar Sandiego]CCJ87551.1 D-beta-hydroxybutyrate dehydrogenase [Cronobacter dublinensis 582]EAR2616185.1 SDR family oxidoreductase [Salmonella enterica]EAU7288899.1 SDR family oxidoreductase [Salmonella enterica]
MVKYDFSGRVALVTGAASGMGLATVWAFCESGATVVMSDIRQDILYREADALKAEGYSVKTVLCDVSDEDQVRHMIEETVREFGQLDAAYNNAGIQSPIAETADASSEEFDRVNAINLRGVWNCMKYELQQMRRQKSGAIVNCSSLGGLVGIAGRGVYHATKHGVLGLTKSAALEYAARGIQINAVCPGIIRTPMVEDMLNSEPEAMNELMKLQPIGRLGEAEEVARAVLWLCSSDASFVTGQALAVDGGYTVQ